MDKYPGYKGGGLWDLDLDQPLAWLPAEVARLSAPQYDLSCNSFGSDGSSTQYSLWGEHGQGSYESSLTPNTEVNCGYSHSLCPPADLTKLEEVYATILSCMEKKSSKKAGEIQAMMHFGLATTQQLQSSFCGVDSQSLGGPCNSVDVNQAWEDVKQGVTGVQDQASNNRPMILHDGPSLKQELELDFGDTIKKQYQPPPATWNSWEDPLQLHRTMHSNTSFGGDNLKACPQDMVKVEQDGDSMVNTEERLEHCEKQIMSSKSFADGSKCTPWEHPLYEDKDHGEFIPEAKKYLGSNDWDVSYPASSPSLLESSQSLKKKMSGTKFCGFCKSNGAMAKNFLSHPLRNDYGKLVCPVLRSYTCPNCGATGDTAHTSSYCPSKRQPHNSLPLAVKLKNTMRNASSVRRFNR